MIVECLEAGKENRISIRELMRLTGYESERKMRKAIAAERKQGAIILSCAEGGYYLPADRDEVEQYVKFMSKEAKEIFAVIKPCRKYLRDTKKTQ